MIENSCVFGVVKICKYLCDKEIGIFKKFGFYSYPPAFLIEMRAWWVSLHGLGKIGRKNLSKNARKGSKTFKNVQKLGGNIQKLTRNIRKYSKNEWKRSKIFDE